MKWEELSMSDRSNLMKTYLQNGVIRLSDMRDHYNKFASGGPLRDEYDNPDQYYDYKTAEEVGNMYDPRTQHWASRDPRTGMILKNPKHPTFGMAIREDQSSGYTPFIDSSTGRYYTLRPEEYATSPYKPTLRRVNKFNLGGDEDIYSHVQNPFRPYSTKDDIPKELTEEEALKAAVNNWDLQNNIARAEFADSLRQNPTKAIDFYRNKGYKTLLRTNNIEGLYNSGTPWYEPIFSKNVNMSIARKIYNNIEGSNTQKAAATANSGVESRSWTAKKQVKGPAVGWFGFEPSVQNHYKDWLKEQKYTDSPENQARFVSYLLNNERNTLITPYDGFKQVYPKQADSLSKLSEKDRMKDDNRSVVNHWEYTTSQALEDWESSNIQKATRGFEALFEKAGVPHFFRRDRMVEGIDRYKRFFEENNK